jgi:L-malate glycosyltransferase
VTTAGNRPVPIVLACQMLSGGGTERQLMELAKALDRKRFEPHVVSFIGNEIKAAELAAHGIKVEILPVRSFFGLSALRHAWTLRRYFQTHGIQIFHAFDMPLAIFGAPVARLSGVPVVLTSVRGHRHLYAPIHQKLLRFSDRFIHGIVANATALRDSMVNAGFPPQRIRLCYNGLDVAQFPAMERTGGTAGRPLTIGTVSVLRPEKNLELLVRAFAQLPVKEKNLQLQITGSGPVLESLQSLARSLGLDEARQQIRFEPAVHDVVGALGRIDIFVLPSWSEGLSNSIMEAMATGSVVAASAVGGNVELVREGETGLLFDPHRVETLVDVLKRLVDDPGLRARMAKNGSEFIRRQFSMGASARTMEGIYEEYLKGPAAQMAEPQLAG